MADTKNIQPAVAQPKARKSYLALKGMDLEGVKPPVRIEEGDPLPSEVSEKEIQELLEIGAIKEA